MSQHLQVALNVPNCTIYHIDGEVRSKVTSGELAVCFTTVDEQEICVLICGTYHSSSFLPRFQKVINNTIPCMAYSNNLYMFPEIKGFTSISFEKGISKTDLESLMLLLTVNSELRVHKEEAKVQGSRIIEASPEGQTPENVKEGSKADQNKWISDETAVKVIDTTTTVVSTAATWTVWGIGKAAEGLAWGITKTSEKVTEYTSAATEERKVSEETKKRVQTIKNASHVALTVSKALVNGCVATAGMLGTQLTTFIETTEYGKKAKDNSGVKTEAAKGLGKSVIGGAIDVWVALENAALVTLGAVGHGSEKIARHKYGNEVGDTVKVGSEAVNVLGEGYVNMKRVGLKAVAGRTVKNSAVELLSTEEEKEKLKQQQVKLDPVAVGAVGMVMKKASQMDNPELQSERARVKQQQNAMDLKFKNALEGQVAKQQL